jgi:hypothetical protein
MAPGALAGRLRLWLLATGCLLFVSCSSRTVDVTVAWTIDPTPPVAAADTYVRVRLSDSGGPVRGAKLRLEAHMTHPGMRPVEADVEEEGEGSYRSRLRLSMPGDWRLVVTGTLPDGRRLVNATQVPGVLAAPAAAPAR